MTKIVKSMKDQVKMTAESVKRKINRHNRKHCFELLGYDFMIDSNLKVWLIEANTNPCLELSSQLLQRLIPCMIEDMCRLTVDQIFDERAPRPKPGGVLNHVLNSMRVHSKGGKQNRKSYAFQSSPNSRPSSASSKRTLNDPFVFTTECTDSKNQTLNSSI